jgi:hypothetical protein
MMEQATSSGILDGFLPGKGSALIYKLFTVTTSFQDEV